MEKKFNKPALIGFILTAIVASFWVFLYVASFFHSDIAYIMLSGFVSFPYMAMYYLAGALAIWSLFTIKENERGKTLALLSLTWVYVSQALEFFLRMFF